MSNKQKYTDQFKGYVADYEETQDVQSLIKLYHMIKDGKVKLTAVDHDSVGFLPENRGNGKCTRCSVMILRGNPVFFQNGKRWCESCATTEEKQLSFYQNYLRKKQPETPAQEVNEDWDTEDGRL